MEYLDFMNGLNFIHSVFLSFRIIPELLYPIRLK